MDQGKVDTPDIIAAFETSIIEVEILAKKPHGKVKMGEKDINIYQVILMHFWFRTRPEMSYVQEGYQKGPLHIGLVQMTFRAYAWSDKDIDLYKKMREQEDFRLLGIIDASVKAAMEALGDELMRYLEEAGEEMKKKEEKKEVKPPTVVSPLTDVYKGFRDMFTLYKGVKKTPAPKMPSKKEAYELEKIRKSAEDKIKGTMWGIYHHFKKHHGMLNW